MKPEIHPAYKEINVACSCGNTFVTGSTIGHDLHIEICAKCHPFYTGTQKLIDTAGRVDRFRQKYGQASKAKASSPAEGAPKVDKVEKVEKAELSAKAEKPAKAEKVAKAEKSAKAEKPAKTGKSSKGE